MNDAAVKRRNLLVAAGFTAMFTWGIMGYGLLGQWLIKGTMFARVINGKPYTNDFVSYYNAAQLGRRCLEGERFDIYDINIQNESLNKLIVPVVPEQPFYLQYPPYFFALTSPLAYIGMLPAWLLWDFAALVALCSTFLSVAAQSIGNRNRRLLALGVVLSSFPCWLSVQLGQTSLFLFAATAAYLHFLEQGKGALAGAVSGVHMIKFQYYPVVGLIGLIMGKAKFLIGAALVLVALLGLSVLVLGVDNVVHYPQALFKGEAGSGVSGVSPHMMQNVRGQLFIIFGDIALVKVCALGAMAAAVAFIGWLWAKPGRTLRETDSRHGFRVLASITILLMLITSPHTHSQDYLLVGLPLLFLRPWLDERIAVADRRHLRLARAMLVWWAPVSWLLFILMQLNGFTYIQPFFLWAILLLIPILLEVQTVIATSPRQAATWRT